MPHVHRYPDGSRVPPWDRAVDLTKEPAPVPEPAVTPAPEELDQVAVVMRLTPAYVESIATFYDMFENEPAPPHDVYVCTNISCSLLGADELFEHFIETLGDDEDFNIRSFECLGACDIGPMASVDG